MSWAMNSKDDITDALTGDDALARSIEQAEQEGAWRDSTPTFVDPKLEEIEKDLSTPVRESYAERRMRELQQEPVDRDAAPGTDAVEAQPRLDWRDTVVRRSPAPEPEPEPTALDIGPARPSVVAQLRPVGAALFVFVPIAALNGLLVGWHFDLLVRVLLASALAGAAWSFFAAGRFRSAAIGAAVHLLTFFTMARVGDEGQLVASFVGLLIAGLGSGMVGLVSEHNDGHVLPR